VSWLAIPLAGVTVVATFAGGAIALRLAREISTVVALTGGVVVAVALFHVIPEAVEATGDAHRVGALAGAGFLFFFLAERLLILHHRDDPAQARAHSHVGALGAGGLATHTFVDGLGIGLAFGVDTATGLLVFAAVVMHDFADGLNAVSFVMHQSGDRRRAVVALAAVAVAPLAGAVVGTTVDVTESTLGHVLAIYGGFFLFMGGTDLLPHAHEHPSWRRVGLTVAGFVGIYALSLVTPH
jgi:zinc transporter, ZIP family